MMRHPLLLLVLGSALALRAFAAEPAPAHRLYGAVGITKAQKNSSTPQDAGLYQRNADGTWTHFGPRILGVTHLSSSPLNPDIMLVSAADGVIRSEDGGKTWRKTTGWEIADVRCTQFDLSDPTHVYAATAWGPLRSTDGGVTWRAAQKGLDRLYCQTLIVDRAHAGRLLLGTEDGLHVSTDGAGTWKRVKFPAVTVLRLEQSKVDANLVLCGTQGQGAQLSRDGGKTWSPVEPSLAKANIYTVGLSRDNAAHLAIAGWETGVRISADGGRTWADRTAGLPTRNIFVVIFDPDVKGRLWVSTFEEGTFYSDDLGRTWKDGGLYGAYASDYVFLKTAS